MQEINSSICPAQIQFHNDTRMKRQIKSIIYIYQFIDHFSKFTYLKVIFEVSMSSKLIISKFNFTGNGSRSATFPLKSATLGAWSLS